MLKIQLERLIMSGMVLALVAGGFFFANALYLEPYHGDFVPHLLFALLAFGLVVAHFLLHYRFTHHASWQGLRGDRLLLEEALIGIIGLALMIIWQSNEAALLFLALSGLVFLAASFGDYWLRSSIKE